ncbi:MAG: cupredoxin domain-containing protein [Gemmatimonadales bacterium]|nr:cupredoxin domain-containing protein [Gemmatimonadales bacterium]
MSTRGSNRRRLGAALFAAAAGLLLSPLRADAQAAAEVRIQDYTFAPAEITVKAGTTVKWTNAEKRASHSILFTGPGGFESDRFFPDESWERRFDKPGRYPYSCGPHPEMKGLVVVTP